DRDAERSARKAHARHDAEANHRELGALAGTAGTRCTRIASTARRAPASRTSRRVTQSRSRRPCRPPAARPCCGAPRRARPSSPASARASPASPARVHASAPTADSAYPSATPPRPRPPRRIERHDRDVDGPRILVLLRGAVEGHPCTPATIAQQRPRGEPIPVDAQALTVLGPDEPMILRRVEPDQRSFHGRSFQDVGRRQNASGPRTRLNGDDALRLRALRPLHRVKLHLRALRKRLETLARDRRMVNKHILATISRGNKPIPLRIVEPLHGSGCHTNTSSTTKERAGEAHTAQPVLAQNRSKT